MEALFVSFLLIQETKKKGSNKQMFKERRECFLHSRKVMCLHQCRISFKVTAAMVLKYLSPLETANLFFVSNKTETKNQCFLWLLF